MENIIKLVVNENTYFFNAEGQECIPDMETLRETLHHRIPGIDLKKGCDRGICGNCTVLLNEKPVSSCMIFTVSCQNAVITTWEGLSKEEMRLYEIFKEDKYFSEHAPYVGIRGLVMICIAQFRKKEQPAKEDFVKALEGNYGRCLDIEKILTLLDTYKETLSAQRN